MLTWLSKSVRVALVFCIVTRLLWTTTVGVSCVILWSNPISIIVARHGTALLLRTLDGNLMWYNVEWCGLFYVKIEWVMSTLPISGSCPSCPFRTGSSFLNCHKFSKFAMARPRSICPLVFSLCPILMVMIHSAGLSTIAYRKSWPTPLLLFHTLLSSSGMSCPSPCRVLLLSKLSKQDWSNIFFPLIDFLGKDDFWTMVRTLIISAEYFNHCHWK